MHTLSILLTGKIRLYVTVVSTVCMTFHTMKLSENNSVQIVMGYISAISLKKLLIFYFRMDLHLFSITGLHGFGNKRDQANKKDHL